MPSRLHHVATNDAPARGICVVALIAMAYALMGTAVAKGPEVASGKNTVTGHQWDVVDIQFQTDELLENTVDAVEVEFSATIENAAGVSVQVPGFYDGGREYVIRFTAPTAGRWSYVTHSSLAQLDGRRGEVTVEPAKPGRRGAVVLDSKNLRNFRYENGDSYFPIAFESDWLFALDAENPDDIPVTRKFVDALADNGFNQVVLNVFAYDVKWKKDERLVDKFDYGSPKAFPFGGDNGEPDHSTLNIEYFQRLDRVIDYLDKKGIAAHLMIYVWNKQVNWPEANSAEDNRYFDYVVRRYQGYPNVIWDISKEALGYGHNDESYISGRIERLRALDTHQRLVTVHDYGYCNRHSDKVDFISVQNWSSELYSVMRRVCSELPGQPILNIEHGGYEKGPYVVFSGSYTSAEVCLERAYQCVFAGTYPTHYWQGAAWNVIIPDVEAMEPASRPRFDFYRHMQTLVDKYDLANLTAGEKKSSSGFCLHNDKDLFVYLVPKENINIGVRLPKNIQGRVMTGIWFDPLSGAFSEPIQQKVTQWPSFDKPHVGQFAILIVQLRASDDGTESAQSSEALSTSKDVGGRSIAKPAKDGRSAKPTTPTWTSATTAAAEHQGFGYLGEYIRDDLAIQVIPCQERYYLSTYQGGLPGAGWDGGTIDHDWIDVDAIQSRLEGFSKVDRSSQLAFSEPPENAIVLFDGSNTKEWASGKRKDGLLQAGAKSKREFQDFQLHFECLVPFKPDLPLSHPDRGNSGVFALGAYEVQVADTFGLDCDPNAWPAETMLKKPSTWCGSIYGIRKPNVNVCLPPLSWQSFDIKFTAARFEEGKKSTSARMTVIQNGVLIHDEVELPAGTGGGPRGPRPEVAKGPIYIQNHHNPTQYRNIWIVEE